MYFLRRNGNDFGFVVPELHTIQATDVEITDEDYNRFFELQAQGKQFNLKAVPTGTGLFDHLEAFNVEAGTAEPGIDEHLLDLEFRVSMLELGGM